VDHHSTRRGNKRSVRVPCREAERLSGSVVPKRTRLAKLKGVEMTNVNEVWLQCTRRAILHVHAAGTDVAHIQAH